MGCGQSTDGFSNHGASPYPRHVTNGDMYGMDNNNSVGMVGSKRASTAKDVTVNRATVEEFLRIEREIAEEENNNPLQPLELKSNQLLKIGAEIDLLEANLDELKKETEKEREDVELLEASDGGDIKSTILEMGNSFDDHMAKEKAEYFAALNKQEIVERELDSEKKLRDQVAEEVTELEVRATKLQELYKGHDELLDKLFGGEYGSVMENQLEAEVDELEAHRGRIMEANFKWRQAQMMLEYACKQLAVAVQKWQDLPTIPNIDLEIRYSVAAETRNNLVAAGQNITGAQRYLDNVTFPYCAPNEVETLNKATEYVFTDMQSAERHDHAQACYVTTHKRANALLQWFDTVINTRIMKDLQDINDKARAKTLELRRERVRLIQEKVKQLWGTDIELDGTLRFNQGMTLEQISKAMLTDGDVVKVEGTELETERASTPPLLSMDELAPVPSNTVIFGKLYDDYQKQLDNLAKQHQEEMEQFMRDQETNTRRINDTLQEKLMARRQRRARMKVEEVEKIALTAG